MRSPQTTIRTVSLGPDFLARSKADLTHVACVRFKPVVIETCRYDGGVTVDRRRFDAAVTLVDAKAKTIVAKWENEGPLPQECAPTIHRRSTDPKPQPIDGGEPNFVAGLLQLEAFQKRPAGQKR